MQLLASQEGQLQAVRCFDIKSGIKQWRGAQNRAKREALMARLVKNYTFSNVTPCSLVNC
jgi:hypothetical protein